MPIVTAPTATTFVLILECEAELVKLQARVVLVTVALYCQGQRSVCYPHDSYCTVSSTHLAVVVIWKCMLDYNQEISSLIWYKHHSVRWA